MYRTNKGWGDAIYKKIYFFLQSILSFNDSNNKND